jgi:hypothetical protein
MKKALLWVVLVASFASLTYAQNLFQNGDFETVDGRLNVQGFTAIFGGAPQPRPLDQLPQLGYAGIYESLPGGWLTAGGIGIEVQVQQVIGVTPHSGEYYVELDSHYRGDPGALSGSASAMTQSVNVGGRQRTFSVAAEGISSGFGYGGLVDDVSLVRLSPGNYRLSLWYLPRTSLAGQNGIAVYLDNTNILRMDGMNDGSAQWQQYQYDFQQAEVPEPATFALVGSGIVGLVLARRRRRAQS